MGVSFTDIVTVVSETESVQGLLQTMGQTFWALIPALVAIILALLTKEVYISLFLGIFVGAMFLGKGNPIEALRQLFEIMAEKMGPSTEIVDGNITVTSAGNMGILIFILELGIIVAMISKAGGANAFGNWAHRHIKSRRGALLTTWALGNCMFIDDYFNRLTVGKIMQPVNDQHRISRAKTAFLVGSLSVSICFLVPISSWASAIASDIGESPTVQSSEAFSVYVKTIGMNFYPILMICFLFITSLLGIDLFGMFKQESYAIKTGDVTGGLEVSKGDEDISFNPKGKVIDLILPIATLIASCCTLLLLKKDGENMFPTETALSMGGCIAIIVCFLLYLPRKLMTLKEYTGCFASGFKSIADVIIILAFAWTLTGVCNSLHLDEFVRAFAKLLGGAQVFLPAIFFLAAMGVAFSTGTSWGTFGIMIPIVAPMGGEIGFDLMVLSIAAVLSGSAFGDQVSPISDVTILAAASCKSNHLGYVKAQLPNALLVASIALLAFLISGVTMMIWVGWIVAVVLFIALIVTAYFIQKKHGRLIGQIMSQQSEETAIAEEVAVDANDSTELSETVSNESASVESDSARKD